MTTPLHQRSAATRFSIALCLALTIAGVWHFVHADEALPKPAPANPDAGNLYDRALPAIVEILTDDHLNGAGCVVDAKGIVLTAAHVVRGSRRIEVLTHDRQRLTATVLAMDLGSDAALLELPARATAYPALPLAGATPRAGADVYLFGAPLYRHGVMLRGTVGRNAPTFEYLPGVRTYVEAIHVAGDGPRGTSGGPWLNADGRVVGMQSASMTDTLANRHPGIAMLIPVERLRNLIEKKADIAATTIGAAVEEIWEQDDKLRGKFPLRTEGLVLWEMEPLGPASRAGLIEGDVVTAVDGKPVRYRDEFLRLVRDSAPEAVLKFTYLRAGQLSPRTAEVRVMEMAKR